MIQYSEAPTMESKSRGILDAGLRGHDGLLPCLRHLLDPARQHRPKGPKALQQVHEAGVVADQDARLVLLDALAER
jgi:hypothetical protein